MLLVAGSLLNGGELNWLYVALRQRWSNSFKYPSTFKIYNLQNVKNLYKIFSRYIYVLTFDWQIVEKQNG